MKELNTAAALSSLTHGTLTVGGLKIAYREAGDPASPQLVLLHGFPASSHQYRNLIPVLADRFHVIAPDYPGFGNSDLPDPATFAYTFDKLAEVTEKFLEQKGFDRFGVFMQDYGDPVGFRIISRHPDWAQWLIIQNTNAYEEGFTAVWDGVRNALWKNRSPETEAPLAGLLQLDGIQTVYLHGHKRPELISPDNWNMDFRFIERPNARRVQLDLFYDYKTNVALYGEWQRFLRERQPKTLIFWGQNDFFFTREGGEAFLRDLPDAEMHRLDSGHFAVEDSLPEIAGDIRRFYDEKVSSASQPAASRKAAK
jgi:pimeloyl-ACP methyl ester carboxylesterase